MNKGEDRPETSLIITIDMTDQTDFDWIRQRILPMVEEGVQEIVESGRLDGDAEVSWEQQP
jgi:hypothetical protein